jgi:hypothetical protein
LPQIKANLKPIDMRMLKKLKWKWPIVLRKTLEAEQDKHHRAFQALRKEGERKQKEWDDTWHPLFKRFMKIEAKSNYTLRDMALIVRLDPRLMEETARLGKDYWSFIARMAAVDLERQLATMSFSGLCEMALEYERRRPTPMAPLSAGIVDPFEHR